MLFRLFLIIIIVFIGFFSFSLKITEIFYDGRDEFIEIFNDKNSYFSGYIYLSGMKSSLIKEYLIIKPYSTIVLSDKGLYFSGEFLFKSGFSFNLPDKSSINVKLIFSGKVLDTFYVSGNLVSKFDNKKTSFEKYFMGNKWIIDYSKKSISVKSGFFSTPGYVNFDIANNFGDGINYNKEVLTCGIEFLYSNGNYKFIFTGNKSYNNIHWYVNNNFWTSGQNMSISNINRDYLIKAEGEYLNYNCSSNFFLKYEKENFFKTGNLKFLEIHPNNSYNLPEYIKFIASDNISGTYTFEGILRGSKKISLPIKLYSGNTLIISNLSGEYSATKKVIISSLKLLDNGENLSISQSGQVVDSIKYKKGDFLYYSGISGDIRFFYKEKENISCSINLQSYEYLDNSLKLNFAANVSNNKYCKGGYRQIWTYSGGILTGTCNPSYLYFTGISNYISFKIQDLSGNNLCYDEYKFFIPLDKSKNNENCYVKIQNINNLKANLISVLNGNEIKNTNSKYNCKYINSSGQILSNLCNPTYINFNKGINKIDLKIFSENKLICQTKFYLNLYKTTYSSFSSLNSNDLNLLVNEINKKYKSEHTLKKIFSPIKYLYIKDNIQDNNFAQCIKYNSDKLKILINKINNKYKSDSTKRKIFSSISYLYSNNNIDNSFKTLLSIYKVLPDPIGKDLDNEIIILSGIYYTGLYLKFKNKKIKLINPIFSGSNIIFKGKFGLKNKFSCISLYTLGYLLDKKCYKDTNEGDYAKLYYNIDNKEIFLNNLKLAFSGDKVILRIDNFYKVIDNKKYISFLKNLKRQLKKLESHIKKILSYKNKKILRLEKKLDKLIQINIKKSTQYSLLYYKYNKLKKEYKIKNTKKIVIIKEKNKFIKLLKNQISFLKSFIFYVKDNIDKNVYKKYLQNYKLVKEGEKIRY